VPFERRVSQVTGQGARCGLRHPKQTAERARTLDMVRGRMQRALARQALPEMPGQVAAVPKPAPEPKVAVEVVPTERQGMFWGEAALSPEQQLDLFDVA
jgi:hypothetical protein